MAAPHDTTFLDLPEEVSAKIFGFCSKQDLLNYRLVSKDFMKSEFFIDVGVNWNSKEKSIVCDACINFKTNVNFLIDFFKLDLGDLRQGTEGKENILKTSYYLHDLRELEPSFFPKIRALGIIEYEGISADLELLTHPDSTAVNVQAIAYIMEKDPEHKSAAAIHSLINKSARQLTTLVLVNWDIQSTSVFDVTILNNSKQLMALAVWGFRMDNFRSIDLPLLSGFVAGCHFDGPHSNSQLRTADVKLLTQRSPLLLILAVAIQETPTDLFQLDDLRALGRMDQLRWLWVGLVQEKVDGRLSLTSLSDRLKLLYPEIHEIAENTPGILDFECINKTIFGLISFEFDRFVFKGFP